MNWILLISNGLFASVATLIGILGFRTFKTLRQLDTGKSFWIPIFMSGILFLVGSIITVFQEVNLSLTTLTAEITHISQLLALCCLLGGIYSYSRTVSKNLATPFAPPEKVANESCKKEATIAREDYLIHGRTSPEPAVQTKPQAENALECPHHFGYLRTNSQNSFIPEECLSCHRIIPCKHSSTETADAQINQISNALQSTT